MLHEEDDSIRENERLAEEQRLINIEARLSAVEMDAKRYRWLRAQHWTNNTLCVAQPTSINLGTVTLTQERLDSQIDELMGNKND